MRVFPTPLRPDVVLRVGERVQLRAEVYDRTGERIPDAEVEWHSSAPATASLDDAASLLAVARGMTIVTARAGSALGQLPVAVELQAEAANIGFETFQFPDWSPDVADLGRIVNLGHVEFTGPNARIYLMGRSPALSDYTALPVICARGIGICDVPLEVRFPRGAALLSFSLARDFRAGLAARVEVHFEDGLSRVVEAHADGLPWTADRVDLSDDGRVISKVIVYTAAEQPTGLVFDSFSFYPLSSPGPTPP